MSALVKTFFSNGIILLYEVISDADTEDEADLLRNHINEVGGIQEYFNEIGRNHCMYG